jgi:hypothetical protein
MNDRSLCYQLVGVFTQQTVIVVSPLISLIHDQQLHLEKYVNQSSHTCVQCIDPICDMHTSHELIMTLVALLDNTLSRYGIPTATVCSNGTSNASTRAIAGDYRVSMYQQPEQQLPRADIDSVSRSLSCHTTIPSLDYT